MERASTGGDAVVVGAHSQFVLDTEFSLHPRTDEGAAAIRGYLWSRK